MSARRSKSEKAVLGITLEHLQASFPNATPDTWRKHVNIGGLMGGWVEKTATVGPAAYVGPGAIVSGSAQIFGAARMSGDSRASGAAQVYGSAQIFGAARMSGDSRVSGDAWGFSPLQIVGSRHPVNFCKAGVLRIGCKEDSLEWWSSHYRGIGRSEHYTPKQVAEYRGYIALAKHWHKIHLGSKKDEALI